MPWIASILRFIKAIVSETLSAIIGWYNTRLAPRAPVRLIVGVAKGLADHQAADMAASIAYYTLFSIFPLLLGLLALLGIFLPYETVYEQTFLIFNNYLPDATDLIERNISEIIAARGTLGIVAIAGLIWTGSMLFTSIYRVINRVWDISRVMPFWIRKPRDIAMVLGIGVLFLVFIPVSLAISSIPEGQFPVVDALARYFNWVLVFVMTAAVFAFLYKIMPNALVHWRDVLPGAIVAAGLLWAAMAVFIFFVEEFANWELVYGPVGSVIAFLMLVYIAAFILIIGAEVSAEYAGMRRGFFRNAKIE